MKRLALVVALALTACTSPTERYEATCMSYGLIRGTPDWGHCMQTERLIAAQEKAASAAGQTASLGAIRQGTDFMMGY
jgi:hypothetical protein